MPFAILILRRYILSCTDITETQEIAGASAPAVRLMAMEDKEMAKVHRSPVALVAAIIVLLCLIGLAYYFFH